MKKIRIDLIGAISGFDEVFLKVRDELNKNKNIDCRLHDKAGKHSQLTTSDRAVHNKDCQETEPKGNISTKQMMKKLAALEKKYDLDIAYCLSISVERWKKGTMNYRALMGGVYNSLTRWEKYFTTNKIDYIISSQPAIMEDVLLLKLAQKFGIKIKYMKTARIKDHLMFCDNFYDESLSLNENFEKIRLEGASTAERANAKKFITVFRKGFDAVSYMKNTDYNNKRFYRSKFNKKRRPITVKGIVRGQWARFIAKYHDKYLSNPDYSQNYVLYPLHFFPEASVTIYGRWHSRQIQLLKNITTCLPINYLFYVKEHKVYSRRNKFFYDMLVNNPMLKIINPLTPTQKLIQHAKAIITLNSTMGFEGLLLGKPVLVFGNAFYKIAATEVTDFNMLSELIKSPPVPDETKIEDFVMAFLRAIYPGNAIEPSMSNSSLEKKNILLLSEAILQECKIIERKQQFVKAKDVR